MKYLPLLLLLACPKTTPDTDDTDTVVETDTPDTVDTVDTDLALTCDDRDAELAALPRSCSQPSDCALHIVDCDLGCALATDQSVSDADLIAIQERYLEACPPEPCDCAVAVGADCVDDVCEVVWPPQNACQWTSTSTLSGIELTGDPAAICTMTIDEADGTIETGWNLTISEVHDVTVARVGCAGLDASNLRFAEYLSNDGTRGGTSLWCPRCDTGLCPADNSTYSTVVGSWDSQFSWRPRQWTGPSDFGNPPGDRFEPGSYELVIEASGTLASDGGPWSARLSTTVTLTP